MSDEDIKEKITSKKRDLSREEELERGKVWNITTQRYRSKLTTEQAYKSGLLYLAPLNCYLDYSKIKTRCFHPQDEIRSGIVWYVNGKHYTYRFKPDKEKKLNFTYHPGTNTYTTPPVERKSISPPRLDDQRITPEKRDSPIPDTPPRLDLEEYRDPDPDRINLNPVDPELNPNAPEGLVIPNIPEVIPGPNPEPIPEVISEDPEPLEPEPEVIPPEIIEDIEMPGGDQPKYQLRDLPKFGGEKTEDPIEFVYQFENFLRYISHEVNNHDSVEKALTYLGQCLSGKARDWFQTHVGPPRAADHGRSKAEYEQLLKDFKKCFHPMGKTTEQLEMAWANIKWNPTTESIEEFVSKIKQLATVLGKTQEDQVLKIKMSSPSAEVYRLIMQCTTLENIINLINQMQAMNFQSVQPSMPNTAMPFMAAQIDAQKQVTFNSPLDHKVEKMADKLDMLTENMDKLAVSMNDLRQRPRDGRDSSRNRNRSWSRGRDQYRSDSGQRYRNRSDSRNRSWSRGRDRRDRSYDRQYRGRDRNRDYYRDSRDYRDRDYRDSRSNRGDRSRGNNRKGYNGYNNRRSNHCAGCNCNQSCNHNQRSQNRGNSDGRRSSRGNTPCPHESIQSMQDSINLIMDESCNLLDLQDTYKDSLNF